MIRRTKYESKISDAFGVLPIVVLIGARQVGKTSIMKTYPTDGFRDTLFMNGQDSETAALFEKLSSIEQYLKVYLNPEVEGLLLIDEFQYINGISTMMKLLTDKYENLKILCSGSSSLDILQKVEESLAGRVRVIEVLSLSFAEYLLFKDEKLYKLQQEADTVAGEAVVAPLMDVYREYLVYGGLPRAALVGDVRQKTEILNDIYRTYLLNDVRHYVANEHFVGFNRLIRLLATQTSNMFNINELSRESGLGYASCETYIALLEKMYIIKTVEPYFTNKRKVITKMKKVYFNDLGLRNIIYGSFNEVEFRTDNGALFENEVFLELCRNATSATSINFYRTQNGTEVDFVVDDYGQRLALECKFKRFDKPNNVMTLNNFCDEEGISSRYLANMNLSANHNGIQFIQGVFCDRVKV